MADDHNDLTQNIAEPALLPPDDYSGRVLGDFEIIRLIGAGGMGQVYLARQKSLKRQVAIKVLKGELAANVTALRRFQAEAEAVANITHAHIVQVYAIGEEQGLHYMALEYVDGRNLRDYLDRKGLPDLPTALGIMRQVASALERAGELGFVHRDIKPENILLSKKGEVKVTDFGLSRCFATDAPLNLTQSGVTMGTPLYMSPEQVRGQAVDPRSDIYSFGVTCYHMLAGEPPFRGSTAFDVALQHVQGDARPLGSLRPDLPADLSAIVHRMMAKKPEDRYQSAREIITDLSRLSDGTGLTTGAMSIASGAFLPAYFASSTPVASYGIATQAIPTHRAAWRYAIVAGLALAAAVGGAALHWAQAPPVAVVNPADALADSDPVSNSVREKELRRQLADKDHRPDAAAEDILELAEMYIKDRRLDDALRLFDSESIKKMRAFEPSSKEAIRDRELINILTGLGRGIALAYQDRAEDSNAEFQKIVRNYPPLAKKDDLVPAKLKDARPINRGVLEQFFNRNVSGPNWRRAVGDAVERNSKNLGGKMPDELKRLRMIPTKGAGTRG